MAAVRAGTATNWGMVAIGSSSVSAIRGTTISSWGLNRAYRGAAIDQQTGVIGNGDGQYLDCMTVQLSCKEFTKKAWLQVSVGTSHACGIEKLTTYAYCWGRNDNGRLGLSTSNYSVFNKAQKTTGSDNSWTMISAGDRHTCGIKTSQTLWCWGSNDDSRLGDGTKVEKNTPTKIGTIKYLTVQSGSKATCAIATTGVLYCWGKIALGQGNGTFSSTVPKIIQATSGSYFTDWIQISVGRDHVCGIRSGTMGIWCFGSNSTGQLAQKESIAGSQYTLRVGSDKWSKVSSGLDHVCAVKSNSQLWCWGANQWGQIGNGGNGLLPSFTPSREYNSWSNWAEVYSGGNVSCAKRTTGRLYCWGADSHFQLGYASIDPIQDWAYAVQCFPEYFNNQGTYLPKSCRPIEVYVQ